MSAREEGAADSGDATKRRDFESQFARAFISLNRRGRFVELAGARETSRTDPRGVRRWSRYCTMIANLEHWFRGGVDLLSPDTLLTEDKRSDSLKKLGAPEECYAMSMTSEIDGRFLPLESAIRALSDGDNGTTLLICCPDRLAYYWHGEIFNVSAIIRKARRH